MAYRSEKTNNGVDLVIDGFDKGIAPSPHKGIANIQGGNISTEPGEVMASYKRTLQSQVAGSGTLTQVNSNTVSISGVDLLVGSWITITADSGTGLSGSYYYASTGKLSKTYTNQLLTHAPINYLVVGGGGAGGQGVEISINSQAGGGGGGGQVKSGSDKVATGTFAVTVGSGGATAQANGTSSSVVLTSGTVTSAGGVGGKAAVSGGTSGAGGASGSGKAGGTGGDGSSAGGGGGDSVAGSNGTSGTSIGANGGAGTSSSISGSTITYGSGGGGGGGTTSGGVGGSGAGNGGVFGSNGTSATANLGGGGGGGGENSSSNTSPGTGASGVAVISYPTGSLTATGGTITTSGGNTIHTFTSSGTFTVSSVNSFVQNITPGTATFSVISMGQPYQSATEQYSDTSGTIQYRYYILDTTGLIWIHDTATLIGMDTPVWFLPDISTYNNGNYSGLGVFNGWLVVCVGTSGAPETANAVLFKSTSILQSSFTSVGTSAQLGTNANHFTLTGKQGKMYITDGNFVNSYFPNSALVSGGANVQSYCSYSASTTTGTVTALIGGSYPVLAGTSIRLPVFFFTDETLPSAITTNTIYYIQWSASGLTFQVYAAASGGSALDIQTGAFGNQYFNTFYPIGSAGSATYTFTPQRLNLPFFETAQTLAEISNIILVGCTSNTVYQWNQVSALPQDFIPLPENNVVNIISVNNMGYIFAGQKGNIYITNGSSASLVTNVPDYCAGIAGTPSSYREPYFSWGGAMYVRGRVWFSILDQTAAKAGNCGGIWSFVPTNNFYMGQDAGLSLRLENQSSYGTYNGTCPVLIPSQVQTAIGPQYWSGWYSNISTPTYGIDFSSTLPTTQTIIETDVIPTGTLLGKKTFSQIEYKLATPLVSGDTVQIAYRQNATDAYTSCGTVNVESSTELSGYFTANFQNGQWLQLQITLNPLASTSSSFCRLTEVRVR